MSDLGVNWAVLIYIGFFVLMLILLDKFASLSPITIIKVLGQEIRELLKADPTTGALNALGLFSLTILFLVIVIAPSLRDLAHDALTSANGKIPADSDNVPLYICAFMLPLLTFVSVLCSRR